MVTVLVLTRFSADPSILLVIHPGWTLKTEKEAQKVKKIDLFILRVFAT